MSSTDVYCDLVFRHKPKSEDAAKKFIEKHLIPRTIYRSVDDVSYTYKHEVGEINIWGAFRGDEFCENLHQYTWLFQDAEWAEDPDDDEEVLVSIYNGRLRWANIIKSAGPWNYYENGE